MPHYACPTCAGSLSTSDLNISQGVALCRNCGSLSRLAELIHNDLPSEEILDHPPSGCSQHRGTEGVQLRVSHRSMLNAGGLLFFCVFWNSMVSMFLVMVLGSLYIHVFGPLPSWIPAPNQGSPLPLSGALIMGAFLTPFVLIGIWVFCRVIMAIGGSTSFTVGAERVVISSGVGPLRWNRQIELSTIRQIGLHWTSQGKSGQTPEIEIQTTKKPIYFGSDLPRYRLDWICASLRWLIFPASR